MINFSNFTMFTGILLFVMYLSLLLKMIIGSSWQAKITASSFIQWPVKSILFVNFDLQSDMNATILVTCAARCLFFLGIMWCWRHCLQGTICVCLFVVCLFFFFFCPSLVHLHDLTADDLCPVVSHTNCSMLIKSMIIQTQGCCCSERVVGAKTGQICLLA